MFGFTNRHSELLGPLQAPVASSSAGAQTHDTEPCFPHRARTRRLIRTIFNDIG